MAAVVILATILIDFIGFSILIPVLPPYLQGIGYSGAEVGLILALYLIGLVLFLPLWGWISDRVGRRPVILICLLGTAGSFVLLALSEGLGEFCMARLLGGFFGASVGTAQAYMADITEDHERTRGLGLVGGAMGLGMVLGPALGGVLGQVDELLPFYAPAVLALVNFVLASFFLPESRPAPSSRAGLRGAGRALVPTPILVLASAHDNRTRLYLYLFFHVFAAFAALEAMFPLYAARTFGWEPLETGLFLGYIGVVMAVTQGLLIGHVTRLAGEVSLALLGLGLVGTSMLALSEAGSVRTVALLGFGVAVGMGFFLPTFTSLFVKHCGSEEELGEYLAHSQSMLNTGRGIGFLWGGWALDRIGVGAPFLLGGLGILAALAIFAVGLPYLIRSGR